MLATISAVELGCLVAESFASFQNGPMIFLERFEELLVTGS
jgi:hypothetical protein